MGFNIDCLRSMMAAIRDVMVENKDYLCELDSAIGDGDLGLTMTNGFNAVVRALTEFQGEDLGAALMQSGMAMNAAGSSTMGTLVSSAMVRAAKTGKGKSEVDDQGYLELAKAAVQGIMDRGKAQVGDKTILDSLVPAVEALEQAVSEGKTMSEAYNVSLEAAKAGFEKTKDMIHQHGRGHYYGEKSKGKYDPGAAVGVLVTKAIRDLLNN